MASVMKNRNAGTFDQLNAIFKQGPAFPEDFSTLRKVVNDGLRALFGGLADSVNNGTEVVEIRVADRMQAHLIRPKTPERTSRAALLVHSGGLYCGDHTTDEFFARAYAYATRSTVLCVNYRLLPEATVSELVDDLVAGYLHLHLLGFSPRDIVVFGGSGGGAGTFYLLPELKKRGLALPLAGAALFPAGGALEYAENSLPIEHWPSIVADQCAFVRSSQYLFSAGEFAKSPAIREQATDLLKVSSLVGLPPMYITGGSRETYFSQQEHLAFLVAQAGVNVTWRSTAGGLHATEMLAFVTMMAIPEAVQAFDDFIKWVEAQYKAAGHA